MFEGFPKRVHEKQVIPGAGPLLSQGFNLTILVGINKIKHIPNTKDLSPLVSDKKIFKVLPIGVLPMEVYIENFDLSVKIKDNRKLYIYIYIFFRFIWPISPMLHTKPQGHWIFSSREEDFKGFLPYMGEAANLVMWPRRGEQTFIPSTR